MKADLAGWDDVAAALAVWKRIHTDVELLEQGRGFDSRLFSIARTLLRMATEDAKPNSERLPEFAESSRVSLEQRLYSAAPIYDDLEILKLADSFSQLIEEKGAEDPLVVKVLDGKSPRAGPRS